MTAKVDEFMEIIKSRYKIDISKVDERFTSKINTGISNKRQDSVSALNILETYIKNEQQS